MIDSPRRPALPPGTASPAVERLHSLDALRGVAALSVVFWHWGHFFYAGTEPGAYTAARLPFYALFRPLYAKGWLAVDLFFVLSGFIFFWLYATPIRGRRISAPVFGALRFSRLYPLHLATLLVVAAAQAAFRRTSGSDFVYAWNDARHFVLNLLFASSWGFERGYSFNAPVWSVSVEIFLYAVFFVLCRFVPTGLTVLAALSALGHVVVSKANPALGSGIGSFFLGGCVFRLYERIVDAGRARQARWPLVVATVAAWSLAGLAFHREWNLYWTCVLGVFPVTILTLGILETTGLRATSTLTWLGDVSYSSYLLHFPLQLLFVAVARWAGASSEIFYAPATLIAFFVCLVIVARASFVFLEMPAQRWLRRRLVPGRADERREVNLDRR
ncbi:MAG: acyltransferase [Deltaproteobacteria bacterium]|nr:acyltransferase [Deltaproteobacteria bacterium]